MFRALILAVTLALAPLPAAAESSKIEQVISSQIDAFLVDDFEQAFSFAAPSIKGIFKNPKNFGVMVRKGYPMVWRPSAMRFGALKAEGAGKVQEVYLTDQKGQQFVALYHMVMTDLGWKISGVEILTPNDMGA